MSKRLTPIGKAIAIYEDLSKRMDTRTAGHEQVVGFLKLLRTLLPEEKQFAKDAFYMGEGNTKIGDFDKFFYKQYEDEE